MTRASLSPGAAGLEDFQQLPEQQLQFDTHDSVDNRSQTDALGMSESTVRLPNWLTATTCHLSCSSLFRKTFAPSETNS